MKTQVTIAAVAALALTFAFSTANAESKKKVSALKKALGVDMVAYAAPDKSFAMYQPAGWTATPNEMGISFVQSSSDQTSARIDILLFQFPQPVTARDLIAQLAEPMQQQYPTVKFSAAEILSTQPDLRAIMFTYKEGEVEMSGFGLALCMGNGAMWAHIVGKDAGFKEFNPVMVLTYALQSMKQGAKPNKPQIPKMSKAGANKAHKDKMGGATVMTHFWNMAPYIVPDAFSTYIPPIY